MTTEITIIVLWLWKYELTYLEPEKNASNVEPNIYNRYVFCRFGVCLVAVLDVTKLDPRLQLNPGPDYKLKESDYCFYIGEFKEEYSKIGHETSSMPHLQKTDNDKSNKNLGKDKHDKSHKNLGKDKNDKSHKNLGKDKNKVSSLSELNLWGTKFCVRNRQVFGLYRLN